MANVTLKNESQRGKYGLVRVNNPDGTLNREYKITSAELETLHQSGNGIPPGCTKEEWESGRASVAGKDFEVGDIQLKKDGAVVIKYAEKFVDNHFVESYVRLEKDEYVGIFPQIIVLPTVFTNLAKETDPDKRRFVGDKIALSIVNGLLEY